jgi:hypothetical protein
MIYSQSIPYTSLRRALDIALLGLFAVHLLELLTQCDLLLKDQLRLFVLGRHGSTETMSVLFLYAKDNKALSSFIFIRLRSGTSNLLKYFFTVVRMTISCLSGSTSSR